MSGSLQNPRRFAENPAQAEPIGLVSMSLKLPSTRRFVLMGLAFATIGGGLSIYLEGPWVIVLLFGLVMTMLLAAVLQKEHDLILAIDEHTRARLEYEAMVGQLPIGLFATLQGKVLFTNETWAKSHGTAEGELFERLHSLDREQILVALERAESDHLPFSMTLRANALVGTVHYEAYGTPVVDSEGNLRHVLVFCVDVSPIVRAKNEVSRKHREVDEKNYQLNAALRQVERSLETMVETMVRSVEVKDPYTAGHSSRVRQYSVWMGELLGLSPYELRTLSHGALIHDVGKIGIPDEILLKPGQLTPMEFDVIKLHTIHGANIVADIDIFRDCVPIVRWHHERLDGSGYPDGLAGDDIPFLARIVAVSDVFDAMTSNRSYRQPVACQEALEIMAQDVAAGRLDAIAFDALRSVVADRGMIPQADARVERKAA
jgi:HD-GYP domain-containing protein (c-di-GMP phosphodiesterase class II)